MTFAKLVHDRLEYAPNPILRGGNYIGNPPASEYEAEGYKPVQYADQPEPLGVGWWNESWTETDDAIVQSWEWHEATDEDEISDAEAMQMLTGGESV